jgi:hypothetical protein
VTAVLAARLKDLLDTGRMDLSPKGTAQVAFTPETLRTLAYYLTRESLDPGATNDAYTDVMLAPNRIDYRHRYLARLKPAHRASFMQWRQFGILLPFGAPNAHLNLPNKFIFGPNNKLLMNDSSSPLEGWRCVRSFPSARPLLSKLPLVSTMSLPQA